MRRILKFFKYVFILLVSIIVIFSITLMFFSPGKLPPIKNENGEVVANSISQKIKLDINGIKQGMFIVGDDTNNPILLFLHGGPGSPEYIWFSSYFKELQKDFTLCFPDQRGAGMSYYFGMEDFNVNTLVEDSKEIAKYLSSRFKQEKIYLVGHSWGTFLGIKTIDKYPELFKAYIGIAQISNQLESEKLTYNFLMEKSILEDDEESLEFLSNYDMNDAEFSLDFSYMDKRNALLQHYGYGMMRTEVDTKDIYKILLTFPGYTAMDKIKIIPGAYKHYEMVWPPLITDGDLVEKSSHLKTPIYILHGKYDLQVSYTLSQDYFDKIKAPRKKFISFNESSHTPFVEERGKFLDVMRKIKVEIEEN